MSTDLTAWLDELDDLRDAATPGPWVAAEYDSGPGDEGVAILAGSGIHERVFAYAIDYPWCSEASCVADAALIVAAANALPKLTAGVRAVLDVATWCDQQAASRSHYAEVDPRYRSTIIPYEAAAERIRKAVQ